MYICNCRGITDSQIMAAIGNGACTREQLIKCFGLGRDCGKCNREIRELLSSAGHTGYDLGEEQTGKTEDACHCHKKPGTVETPLTTPQIK